MNRREELNIIINKCKEGLEIPADYIKELRAIRCLAFIQGLAEMELMQFELDEKLRNMKTEEANDEKRNKKM